MIKRFLTAGFLVSLATAASATPLLFVNDDAGFNTATSGLAFGTESFELSDAEVVARCGAATPATCGTSGRYEQSKDYGDVTVSTAAGDKFRLETAYKDAGNFLSDGDWSVSAAPGGFNDWGPVTFSFDFAVNAVIFDLLDVATVSGRSSVVTFSTDSGFSAVLFNEIGSNDNRGRLDSIGFFDANSAFTSFTIGFDCRLASSGCATDDLIGVDRLRYASVPEPASIGLMLVGLVALWRCRRASRS